MSRPRILFALFGAMTKKWRFKEAVLRSIEKFSSPVDHFKINVEKNESYFLSTIKDSSC